MFELTSWLMALPLLAAIAVATWLVSLKKRDVSIVDSIWPVMIWSAGAVYIWQATAPTPRAWLAFGLSALWAVRLFAYITVRNWDEPEDRRYQQIRERNQPRFEIKSLYLVFVLQAALAWVVSLPLLATALAPQPFGWLDLVGAVIVLGGLAYETLADHQLARFKADARNRGRVLDAGLWRHTRHPNYFGEWCVWWGFYLMALAAGGWWSLPGPLLMSVLLFRVSGVTLLESDIAERRPEYARYKRRTNAFFPGPRKA